MYMCWAAVGPQPKHQEGVEEKEGAEAEERFEFTVL